MTSRSRGRDRGGGGTAGAGRVARAAGVVPRWLFMLGLWWVLSEGNLAYLGYGVVAAGFATWVSLLLMPVHSGSAGGIAARVRAGVGLAGWSLMQLVLGGVDVARRVLSRRVDVDPEVVTVDVRLPAGMAREFALGLMSLLPGTLVQETEGDRARLHALSPNLDAAGQWRELEQRVMAATGSQGAGSARPE